MSKLAKLVDNRTGVFTAFEHSQASRNTPTGFVLTDVQISDSSQFSPWSVEPAGGGSGFSARSARGPAIGESIERYCGLLPAPDCILMSTSELDHAGKKFVSPEDLVPFSPKQLNIPNFPFALPKGLDQVLWTSCQSILEDETVFIPAELIWASLPFHVAASRKPLSPLTQAGLAAGESFHQAVTNAILEIVERDSMTLGWVGRRGVRILNAHGSLKGLGEQGAPELRTDWISFDNDFGLPVIGALLKDQGSGYLTLGMSCGTSAWHAARRAFCEACQLQMVAADYDEADSFIGRATLSSSSPLAAYRQDRNYAAEYNSDFSDVMDYGCHQQIHLDPNIQLEFEKELQKSYIGEVELADLEPDDRSLTSRFLDNNMSIYVKNLTTPDIATLGGQAVRVVIPGMLPNHAAGLPYLGSTRMQKWLKLSGQESVRTIPLPH